MKRKKRIETDDKEIPKLKVTSKPEKVSRLTVMEGKTDLEIWNAFKHGNEGAFNHIYHINFKSLYNFGCQIHPDPEVIKDLLQDLFIDLRARSQYMGEVRYIKAYLFKALKRRVQEYERRLKKQTKRDYQEFEITFSSERQMINNQLDEDKRKFLAKAMNSLTKRQREVIFYYFYENMGYEEIALTMGIGNIKSVRNLVYRSLNVMRKKSSGSEIKIY